MRPANSDHQSQSPRSHESRAFVFHRRLSVGFGLLTVVIGVLGLIGWSFNIPILTTIISGHASMKENTSFCFIFMGAALMLLNKKNVRRNSRSAALTAMILFCAGVAALLGAVTIIEYLAQVDFGIDQALIMDRGNIGASMASSAPGRMSPIAALNFVMLGLAVWAYMVFRKRQVVWQALVLLTLMLTMVAVVGHLFDPKSLERMFPYSTIALHTTLGFISLTLGLLLLSPAAGLVSLFSYPRRRSLWNGVVLAIVSISVPLLACFIQFMFWSILRPLTWLLFYPAVFVSSWIGGLRVGLLATLVSTGLGWYFFVPPEQTFYKEDPRHLLATTVFVCMGLVFGIFNELFRKANRILKAKELELSRLNERLQAADRLKTQFFANVSHELRTPLTLILGPVESLLSRGASDEQRATLELIRRNARGLVKQVNDLLDVARVEAGKMELSYFEVDLAKLVRQVVSNFGNIALERRCHLIVKCPETLTAQIDGGKLERVLVNLLANAFKFVPDEGIVRCTLQSDSIEQGAVIEVADSGLGVPEKYRDSIFERFFQVEASATRGLGGTGLGLSIVKDFVELHHGQVKVGRAPEGGALFTINVPLVAPEGSMIVRNPKGLPTPPLLVAEPVPPVGRYRWEQVRPLPTLVRGQQPELRKPLVLVVEDNPDMREYICDALGAEFWIETAENGREGLEKAIRLHPDLVISDIMMPEMSGDQMFREMQSNPELKIIPIIILSARADEELRIELLKEGAQDYLIKPFIPEELRSKARNLLAVRVAEAKYRGLLESAQDSIVVVGSDGKIKFANHQTTSWFGYSNDELVGQPIEMLVPEKYRPVHVAQRNEYIHNPKPRQMAERIVDLRGRRKDGSEFPVSIALSPSQTLDGEYITAIVRDISEMRKLSDQALFAREQAISAVSHDLKNPLAAIQASIQFILSKRLAPEKREQFVDRTLIIVDRASKQMITIIQDLLDFSKVEAHRLSVDKHSEDAASIVSEVCTVFEPLAREKSIELRREIAAGLGTVYCERGRIVRVLSNLIGNAIKFTQVGGRVTVSVELKGGNILFAVRDNGSGIKPEQLPHVFERYWQAEETARKGTGLGLAIARGFVEAHHGKIWVESQVGHGSTFYFSLPRFEEIVESA